MQSSTTASTKPRLLIMQHDFLRRDLFAPLQEVAQVTLEPADQQLLESSLADYDAVLTDIGLHLHGALVAAAPRLRVVATCTTGLDHIDVSALEARGIELLSLKYDHEFLKQVSATAELAWALLLAVVRRVPDAFASVLRGEWDRDRYRGHQLRGRTLGILGFGRLGRIMADIGSGFHMRVIACDQQPWDAAGSGAEGVAAVDLDTLLRESDVLSIHIHLTKDNYHFIDAPRLARMKSSAVLINTSRGAIVDERALVAALESGHLAGAGVDVLEGEVEGQLSDHPLIRYARTRGNLVITPHIGGVTHESNSAAMAHTVAKLQTALQREAQTPAR